MNLHSQSDYELIRQYLDGQTECFEVLIDKYKNRVFSYIMMVVKDRELLKKIDAAADLFLFPSLYDTSPLTIREAAAMHTPSVMINGSMTAEVIKADVNGFLTENTAESYAAMLRQLIEKPELITSVARNASKTLTRSWEDVIDEVRERYKEIIRSYPNK